MNLRESPTFYLLKKGDDLHEHWENRFYRTNYSNLIRYTRKLSELNPFDRQAKEDLRAAIEAEEPLLEKEWLLQQLDR